MFSDGQVRMRNDLHFTLYDTAWNIERIDENSQPLVANLVLVCGVANQLVNNHVFF